MRVRGLNGLAGTAGGPGTRAPAEGQAARGTTAGRSIGRVGRAGGRGLKACVSAKRTGFVIA